MGWGGAFEPGLDNLITNPSEGPVAAAVDYGGEVSWVAQCHFLWRPSESDFSLFEDSLLSAGDQNWLLQGRPPLASGDLAYLPYL